MNKKVDYLIVGQGIAGTMLAWFLEKAGQSFMIIDNNYADSSTNIAAGIINPITGRRFVKSWMIEDLLPFAKQTYQEIEAFIDLPKEVPIFKEMEIIRYFQSNVEGNNWVTKTSYEEYKQYLSSKKLSQDLSGIIHNSGGYGIVHGAKVDLRVMINYFQLHYKTKGQLKIGTFDYAALQVKEDSVTYKDIEAKKVIFCEGYAACRNPWFKDLPFESAKGEVLLLRIPTFQTPYIIKKNQFLVPVGEDVYWFGSNYEWEDLTNTPTLAGKAYLEERLADILKVDFEILDHMAAVRPVLKDRRPVLGVHPAHPSIAILNGMGTKGTSIAPYWANRLVRFLLGQEGLAGEVGVGRFIPS